MTDKTLSRTVSRLIADFQSGDQEAAIERHDQYRDRLMQLVSGRLHPSFGRRLGLEDVVQSAIRSFLRIVSTTNESDRAPANRVWSLLAAIAIYNLNAKLRFHLASKRTINQEDACSVVLAVERLQGQLKD